MAEHPLCKWKVAGSIPVIGTRFSHVCGLKAIPGGAAFYVLPGTNIYAFGAEPV
jgi:hypothetical protein